jgi:cytochrome c oxidase accessory protein FixG
MVDDDTIAVTYDFKRGESRGHLTKEDKQVKLNPDFIEWDYRGDCIDCHQCVDVCPTGIDIRDGIQLECVNCTACMDACDSIMTKIDRPKGLIKYSSYSHITQPEKKIFTGRIIAYLVVLAIVTGVLIQLLMTRPDTEAVILRQPGTLFQKVSESSYSNMYQLKVINKTFTPMNFTIKLLSPKGVVNPVGSFSEIPSQGISEGRFFTILNSKELNSSKIPLIFGIYIENKLIIDPKKPIAIPIIP